MLFNGNLRLEKLQEGGTDGSMEIHPYVLQDIGFLGPMPKKFWIHSVVGQPTWTLLQWQTDEQIKRQCDFKTKEQKLQNRRETHSGAKLVQIFRRLFHIYIYRVSSHLLLDVKSPLWSPEE